MLEQFKDTTWPFSRFCESRLTPAKCMQQSAPDPRSWESDRGGDRDVEKRSVSIQQAQRATLAHAEDGRAEVYLVIQFEQIDARCRGLDQVGNWEMRWNWNRNEGKRVREQKGWRSR